MRKGRTGTTPAEKVATVLDQAMSATLGIQSHHDAADRADIERYCYKTLRERYSGVVATLIPVKAEALELAVTDIAYRAMAAITDDKLDAASPKDLAIIMGISLEKRQLLRGEPTAIIGHTHEAAGNLDRLCEAIVSERERRRALDLVVEPSHNHEIEVSVQK